MSELERVQRIVMEAELLAAGYRKTPKPALTHADWLYQKRVMDGDTTRYFINVYEYLPRGEMGLSYQADMHGELPGDRSVTIEAGSWVGDATIPETEAFFEKAFVALGLENYDKDTESGDQK